MLVWNAVQHLRNTTNATGLSPAPSPNEQILYRDHDYDGAAVSARRFLALAGAKGDTRYGGDDDYFSTDFSDSELRVGWGSAEQAPAL